MLSAYTSACDLFIRWFWIKVYMSAAAQSGHHGQHSSPDGSVSTVCVINTSLHSCGLCSKQLYYLESAKQQRGEYNKSINITFSWPTPADRQEDMHQAGTAVTPHPNSAKFSVFGPSFEDSKQLRRIHISISQTTCSEGLLP